MHSFLVFFLIFSQSFSSSPSPAANFFLHYREFWYSCHSNLSLYFDGFEAWHPKPPPPFFYFPVDDLQDCFRIGYRQASCGPFPDIASLSRLGQFLRYLIEDPSFIKTLVEHTRSLRRARPLFRYGIAPFASFLSFGCSGSTRKGYAYRVKMFDMLWDSFKNTVRLGCVISPSLLFPLFPVYPEDILSPLRASVAHKRPRQSEWKEKDETELSAVLESSALPYEVDDERAILPSAIRHAASAVSPSLEPFVCFSVTPPPTTSLVAPTAASLVAFSDFPSSSSSPASTSFISLSPQFPPTSLPSSPFVPPSPSPDPFSLHPLFPLPMFFLIRCPPHSLQHPTFLWRSSLDCKLVCSIQKMLYILF